MQNDKANQFAKIEISHERIKNANLYFFVLPVTLFFERVYISKVNLGGGESRKFNKK